jgi:hypothetical protein
MHARAGTIGGMTLAYLVQHGEKEPLPVTGLESPGGPVALKPWSRATIAWIVRPLTKP